MTKMAWTLNGACVLLQGDKFARRGGADTGAAVGDGLVGNCEFTEVIANHVRLHGTTYNANIIIQGDLTLVKFDILVFIYCKHLSRGYRYLRVNSRETSYV